MPSFQFFNFGIIEMIHLLLFIAPLVFLTNSIVNCSENNVLKVLHAELNSEYAAAQTFLPDSVKTRVNAILHDTNASAVGYTLDQNNKELRIIYDKMEKNGFEIISKFYWKLYEFLTMTMYFRGRGGSNSDFDTLKNDIDYPLRHIILNNDWSKVCVKAINFFILKKQILELGSKSKFSKLTFNDLLRLTNANVAPEELFDLIGGCFNKEMGKLERDHYKSYLSFLKIFLTKSLEWIMIGMESEMSRNELHQYWSIYQLLYSNNRQINQCF